MFPGKCTTSGFGWGHVSVLPVWGFVPNEFDPSLSCRILERLKSLPVPGRPHSRQPRRLRPLPRVSAVTPSSRGEPRGTGSLSGLCVDLVTPRGLVYTLLPSLPALRWVSAGQQDKSHLGGQKCFPEAFALSTVALFLQGRFG